MLMMTSKAVTDRVVVDGLPTSAPLAEAISGLRFCLMTVEATVHPPEQQAQVEQPVMPPLEQPVQVEQPVVSPPLEQQQAQIDHPLIPLPQDPGPAPQTEFTDMLNDAAAPGPQPQQIESPVEALLPFESQNEPAPLVREGMFVATPEAQSEFQQLGVGMLANATTADAVPRVMPTSSPQCKCQPCLSLHVNRGAHFFCQFARTTTFPRWEPLFIAFMGLPFRGISLMGLPCMCLTFRDLSTIDLTSMGL
jgi:hypothetical protein